MPKAPKPGPVSQAARKQKAPSKPAKGSPSKKKAKPKPTKTPGPAKGSPASIAKLTKALKKAIAAATRAPDLPPDTRARVRENAPKPGWELIYLAWLAEGVGKGRAAKEADVNAKTVWQRRKEDAEFAAAESAAEKEAHVAAVASVESEIHRRAIEGIQTHRYHHLTGTLIETKTTYSDTLLLAMARKLETGSWKDSAKVEVEEGVLGFLSMTRADRKKKLAEAKAESKKPL